MDRSEIPALQAGRDRVIRGLPMLDSLGQHGATGGGEHDPPHASVLLIVPDLQQPAALQWPQVLRCRGSIHRKLLGQPVDGERRAPIKRHQ